MDYQNNTDKIKDRNYRKVKSIENISVNRKEIMKKELIRTIIIVVVVFGVMFGGFYIFKDYMGTEYPIVVVTSDSMTPNINKGDLLFVKHIPAEDIKAGTHEDLTGDVIVYETQGVWPVPTDAPVVHRVINKFQINGTWYFNVQGDANAYPDPPNSPSLTVDVPEDKIYGVVVGRIQKIGWIKIWLTETNLAVPIMIILGFLLVISIVYDLTHPEDDEELEEEQKIEKSLKKLEKIDKQKISDKIKQKEGKTEQKSQIQKKFNETDYDLGT
ncbi:MAG: signal peptidase I [Promethearchaeota archaeon]